VVGDRERSESESRDAEDAEKRGGRREEQRRGRSEAKPRRAGKTGTSEQEALEWARADPSARCEGEGCSFALLRVLRVRVALPRAPRGGIPVHRGAERADVVAHNAPGRHGAQARSEATLGLEALAEHAHAVGIDHLRQHRAGQPDAVPGAAGECDVTGEAAERGAERAYRGTGVRVAVACRCGHCFRRAALCGQAGARAHRVVQVGQAFAAQQALHETRP
jgi:hypothetical protein